MTTPEFRNNDEAPMANSRHGRIAISMKSAALAFLCLSASFIPCSAYGLQPTGSGLPDPISDALGGTRFLIIWVTFSVLALVAIIAVLVWAVRSRQFSNQDHARYLPLEAAWPDDKEESAG